MKKVGSQLLSFAEELKLTRSQAVDKVKTGLKSLLEEVPEIQAIRWHQWYNDYEDHGPVGYNLDSIMVKLDGYQNENKKSRYQDSEGFIEIDEVDILQYSALTEQYGDSAINAIKSLQDIFENIDTRLFFEAFSDNCNVIVTKSGIEVEETNN